MLEVRTPLTAPAQLKGKAVVPRDFSFAEAATVVICVTIGLILGSGGVAVLARLLASTAQLS